MRSPLRSLLVALGALSGVGVLCVALPAIDPRCGAAGPLAALFGSCGAPERLTRALISLGFVAAGAIPAILAVLIVRHAAVHHRLAEELSQVAASIVVAGHAIGLVPGIRAAVVAGLRRPRIYCSQDVLRMLNAQELKAVLLHEHHHALTHAPVKLVVLTAVAALIGRTATGSRWIESARSRIEIEADNHAIAHGATRPALAGAILKLAPGSPTLTLAGFASATDLRLGALLRDAAAAPVSRPNRWLLATAGTALVVATCVAFSVA